jgi:bifunctional non-homologous end joining protein LigD
VSTPVTWDEVEDCTEVPHFGPADVLARVERDGDLLAPLVAEDRHRLP